MNPKCPNSNCRKLSSPSKIIKDGTFKRACDSRLIQRFRCKICGTRFSSATFSLEKYQKKRRVNPILFRLLASGVSMRRASLILGLNRKTVHRKFDYLAKKSSLRQKKFLKNFESPTTKIQHIQIDDLVTIEHTKLKPVFVSLAVDVHSRFIIGAEVSTVGAFGHLAKISVKKYGKRKNTHNEGLTRLFETLEPIVSSRALIESDEHKNYPPHVRKYFPKSNFNTYQSIRGCIAGQGELKKTANDPLFVINHTCAMLRANINRLIRKTWCTSKNNIMLKKHLDIFIAYYNLEYLKGDFL